MILLYILGGITLAVALGGVFSLAWALADRLADKHGFFAGLCVWMVLLGGLAGLLAWSIAGMPGT